MEKQPLFRAAEHQANQPNQLPATELGKQKTEEEVAAARQRMDTHLRQMAAFAAVRSL